MPPRRRSVFQWHGDTFDLPAGAVQLARSAACEQQAFRFGPSAYGLQFHVEVTGPMIDDWLCEPGGCAEVAALDYIDPAEIRQPHAARAAGHALAGAAGISSIRRTLPASGRLARAAGPRFEFRASSFGSNVAMQIVITAVGPDNRGLADPIIHYVTGQGANIAEIQMYDHDEEALFAMLLRIELAGGQAGRPEASDAARSAERQGLSIRVWSPDERAGRPRLAICTTLSPGAAAGPAAGDSRRPAQGRAGRDDRQPAHLPRRWPSSSASPGT